MPAPLAVDKQAARVLVVAVGVREAAARLQLPPGTVAAWSARGKWLDGKAAIASAISGASSPEKAAISATLPASMRPVVPATHASGAINAADALSDALSDDERETRLSLSRTARRLAKESEAAPIVLETPADVLAVAKLYAVTHRIDAQEGKSGPATVVNLAVLLDGCPIPSRGEVIEVEASDPAE